MTTIPLKQSPSESWQQILSGAVRDAGELCRLLDIDRQALPGDHPLLAKFPVRVPLPWLARIKKGDPLDPLLLQVFPAMAETQEIPGYSLDPLEEARSNPLPGVLHKYRGRALLLLTSACAIHCRYCFRRHFPYQDNQPGREHWQESLDYIRRDASITEVIFSGGDPLTLPDNYLEWFYEQLADIPHVERIRLHTRLPVMIPQRITPRLCNILANPRFRTILVIHSNHAQEFDASVDHVCEQLRQSGISLLNQSVLLKGINDSAEVLAALSERLFAAGVLPYYLHLLDKVAGAGHFDVADEKAQTIMQALRESLPGYLVPRLVREEPGEGAKTPA